MPAESSISIAPSPRLRWSLTVLVVLLVALTACSSEDTQPVADPAAGQGTPQYGASLDEWVEAQEAGPETTTEPDSTTQTTTTSMADGLGEDLEAIEEPVDAEDAETSTTDPELGTQNLSAYREGYAEITWQDLLPPGYDSDAIFASYRDRLAELDDGSPEANEIYAEMQAEYLANSGAINRELDGTQAILAGFVAPLEFDGEIITEFLLVPYFGACIHVPAPPPNQTILVTADEGSGLAFEESWGPIWVAGTLTVGRTDTYMATSSFTMTDVTTGVYDEFG